MRYEIPKIGVYICHCGMNIAPKVDVEAVAQFAGTLDHVVIAREYKFMCSNPGQEFIVNDIRERGLNRVVVASCSPRMHEPTFRKACESAGINPYCFQMSNIREQSSWVTVDPKEATEKAKKLVQGAIARVSHHRALFSREVPVKKSVLVIGAGIAGMQASLSAAEAGYQVYLVEREPTIGGHMAKFDKTFPTLDCAACIMTPKMVSVGQHNRIQLLTYSDVVNLEGFVGNFKATVRRKPRYVNEKTCTGCGLCAEACPVYLPDPFNEHLTLRKAAYRSFPQAVPITFCIEKKDRAPCVAGCPAGLNVQGYVQLVKAKKYEAAVKLIMERIPLPGVLGRVCPHPCEGVCRRRDVDQAIAIRELKRFAADQVDPLTLPLPEITDRNEKVAVIGSGPAGLTVAYDLRLAGYSVTIFEALPKLGGMLRVGIPDYRLPSKVLDREINAILRLGIETRINTQFGSDITLSDLKSEGFSAVFMGIGAHDSLDPRIPGMTDYDGVIDAVRFLRDVNLGQTVRIGNTVAVIGGGNVAIDAARVAKRTGAKNVILVYRRTESEMPAYRDEIAGAKEEGIQFHFLTAPIRVTGDGHQMTGLECMQTELGSPDASGRRRPVPVQGSEFVIPCDRILFAIGQRIDNSWDKDTHTFEWTKMGTLQVAADTMQTNLPYVFAGGDAVTGPATVVEAIAAGHRAAKGIHAFLQHQTEIQTPKDDVRTEPVGEDWLDIPPGIPVLPREIPNRNPAAQGTPDFNEVEIGYAEENALKEASRCLNCGACSECMECVKACEVHAIDHHMQAEELELEVGAVIVATGFKTFDPTSLTQYGYGYYPEVYTSLEFERLNNATGPTSGKILMKNGKPPERVAIIHCVGSRDSRHRKYCSRVCCMYSMKFAHLIKDKTHADVWEFYIDLRAPGKLYEEFYNRVQEEGVHFVRGRVAEVTDMTDRAEDEGKLTVVAENTLTGKIMRVPVDMVILSIGLEPADGVDEVGRMVGISRDGDGWFTELHAKLAPVSTPVSGVFLAGCCQGPKDIPDTVAQAMGAAGEAVALLAKGTVKTNAEISYIDPDRCSGCKTCIELCKYSAIRYDEGRGIAVVNEALCQGCGSCSSACPSSAAGVKQFTDEQLMSELEAVLS